MKICSGRKHNCVMAASSGLEVFGSTKLLTDSNMKDGYRFPCCQLMVPTVCCREWLLIMYHALNEEFRRPKTHTQCGSLPPLQTWMLTREL